MMSARRREGESPVNAEGERGHVGGGGASEASGEVERREGRSG